MQIWQSHLNLSTIQILDSFQEGIKNLLEDWIFWSGAGLVGNSADQPYSLKIRLHSIKGDNLYIDCDGSREARASTSLVLCHKPTLVRDPFLLPSLHSMCNGMVKFYDGSFRGMPPSNSPSRRLQLGGGCEGGNSTKNGTPVFLPPPLTSQAMAVLLRTSIAFFIDK